MDCPVVVLLAGLSLPLDCLLINYTIHLGANIIEYSKSKCHPQET